MRVKTLLVKLQNLDFKKPNKLETGLKKLVIYQKEVCKTEKKIIEGNISLPDKPFYLSSFLSSLLLQWNVGTLRLRFAIDSIRLDLVVDSYSEIH